MSSDRKDWSYRAPFLRLVTPGGFLKTAAFLTVAFLIGHLLGWREYTGFFSGTAPPGGSTQVRLYLGVLYAFAYFGFALGTPVFLLAAGIFTLLRRIGRRAGPRSAT